MNRRARPAPVVYGSMISELLHRVGLAWIGGALALAVASSAGAQEGDAPASDAPVAPIAPVAEGEAPAEPTLVEDPPADVVQRLLVDAVAEYDEARYLEAQALFQRAHALSPSARTLRGIGMASFEAGQYVVALRALRGALAETERPLSAAQRRHVESLLARTDVFVARLDVEAHPASATIHVDGEPIVREPDGTVLLDAGDHAITVIGDGGASETLRVSLVGGTTRTVVVHVASIARSGSSALGVLGGGALVAAALGTVAALTTGLLAVDVQGQIDAACDGFVCPGSATQVRDRARDLAIATDVIGASSAVLAAAGGVLLAIGLTDAEPPPVSLGASQSGLSVTWRGRF